MVTEGDRRVQAQLAFADGTDVMRCSVCGHNFSHTYEIAKHVFKCSGGVRRPQPPAAVQRREVAVAVATQAAVADTDLRVIDTHVMQHFAEVGGTPSDRKLHHSEAQQAWDVLAKYLQAKRGAVMTSLRRVVLASLAGERRTKVGVPQIARWCAMQYGDAAVRAAPFVADEGKLFGALPGSSLLAERVYTSCRIRSACSGFFGRQREGRRRPCSGLRLSG